jgi:hypothetical protein
MGVHSSKLLLCGWRQITAGTQHARDTPDGTKLKEDQYMVRGIEQLFLAVVNIFKLVDNNAYINTEL